MKMHIKIVVAIAAIIGIVNICSAQELYPIGLNGKVGFVNSNFKIVVDPIYDDGYFAYEGYARVEKNGKWGFLNASTLPAVFVDFEILDDLHDGLAIKRDKKTGLYGFVDKDGKTLIDGFYGADSFSEGKAAVKDQDGWTYIDKAGKVLFPRKHFEQARRYVGNIAIIKLNGLFGTIDENGFYLIKPFYESMSNYYSNGMCFVTYNKQAGGQRGFVDRKGILLIKTDAEYSIPFFDNVAFICTGKQPYLKWSIINTEGKKVVTEIPDLVDVGYFYYGIACATFRVQGAFKSGYIFPNGKKLIDPTYDVAQPFERGVGRVFRDGVQVAFVTQKGQEILVKDIYKGR